MAEQSNVHSKGPMAMCPMASMCRGMAGKRWPGYMLMLPGILLMLVGVLIFVEPKILVWLIAGGTILFGVALVSLALFVRRAGAHSTNPLV